MADATLAQVRNRVLEKLFVLIAGETADAEDAATVEKVIVSTNEELRETGLCYWSDSATPQHLMEHLSAYYATYLANDYMDAVEAAAFVQANQKKAEMKLRELTAAQARIETPTRNIFF